MNCLVRRLALPLVANLLLASGALYGQATPRPAELPDAPGRETVKKVCAACHPAEVVLGKGMTREQWGGIVSNMISRGAKGTETEFADVVDYLSKNLPPKENSAPPGAARQRAAGGGLLAQAGASDKHIVDDRAAARGQIVYIAECITCHGPKGRGTAQGPDIVRSLVVLHDRYGSAIGPFLLKGHPTQSGKPSTAFTQTQIEDLSDFLHQKVGDTLRTGPYNKVLSSSRATPKPARSTSMAVASAAAVTLQPATWPASPGNMIRQFCS